MNAIGTIILAAGEAARMGQPKQLLQWQGRSLLQHAIDKAWEAVPEGKLAVVLGAHADQIAPQLSGFEGLLVRNPDWKSGMGSSLRTGLSALLENYFRLDAVLVLLVDQPLITAAHLQALLTALKAETILFAASRYNNKAGVPAAFKHPIFEQLLQLKGQQGARKIMREQLQYGRLIDCPAASLDLDTPENWTNFLKNY